MVVRLFPRVALSVIAFAVACSAGSLQARAEDPKLPEVKTGKVFNVKDFGAVGDGKTMDTDALRKAIKACNDAGGGQVLVPAGTYLTSTLTLGSNMDFHVEKGALVQFSPNHKDYEIIVSSYEGKEAVICASPLSAENAHDISITGEGTFDGHGEQWRMTKRSKLTDDQWKTLVASGGVVDEKGTTWYPSKVWLDGMPGLAKLRSSKDPVNPSAYEPYRDLLRPVLLTFNNCQRVLFDGPTFRNSAAWNLHPHLCDDVTIRHVTVYNPGYAQNGDGMDLDSCRNVLVEDTKVDAGDDAVCMKSGKDEEGRKLGRPTEHVTVRNCTIGTGHGGIALGSEMSGGIRDVHVSHCTMNGTDTGIRIKTTRGRGNVVEDVTIDDVTMSNMTQSAIELDMYYMVKGPAKVEAVSEATPRIRNITISNLKCDSAARAIAIRGLPEMPIENVTVTNADITAKSAGIIAWAKNITLTNVQLHTGDTAVKVDQSENVQAHPPVPGIQ